MKVNKLRNIVKESVRELMNEQSTTFHRWRGYNIINNSSNFDCTPSGTVQWTNVNFDPNGPTDFWQAVGSPSPGQFLGMEGTIYGRGCWEYLGIGNSFVNTWNATDMGYDMGSAAIFPDCTSCKNSTTSSPTACTVFGCTDPNAMNYNPTILPNCDDGSCLINVPGTSGCGECDASAWPNYNSWVSTWSNSGPFNSGNPNQPCNHICQKMTQWNDKCMGNQNSTQTNILSCKLEEGYEEMTNNGCNC
jgi:hypothetical protein|tara:strand:- start:819 stop:1559 length:741 start_codon:yes stop_codon:yes gene_type:complete